MLKKLRDFLIEYELIAIPVFLLLCVFSYQVLDKIFFTVSPEFLVHPGIEPFYHFLHSVLIWLGSWLVVWVWVKLNFPELARSLKNPQGEIDYLLALIALFGFFGSLLGVAAIVFP